jgi:rhodanese-related sulfurtransferase
MLVMSLFSLSSNPFIVKECSPKDLFNYPISELPIIVDIRSKEEYYESHVLGAISFPLLEDHDVSILEKDFIRVLFKCFQIEEVNCSLEKGENSSSAEEVRYPSLVYSNGGYPDLFHRIFIIGNRNQISTFTVWKEFVSLLERNGIPNFFPINLDIKQQSDEALSRLENYDTEWLAINEVNLLTSFDIFQEEFPLLLTKHHHYRFSNDSMFGTSIVAQEKRFEHLLASPSTIQPTYLRSQSCFFPSLVEEWGLYLGSNIHAGDRRIFDVLGITFVINITIECPNHFEGENPAEVFPPSSSLPSSPEASEHSSVVTVGSVIEYKRFPALDTVRQVMDEYWEEGYQLLQQCATQGKKVLVHCAMGKSRSASLVAYYLMKQHRWSVDETLTYLKKCRSQIAINKGFLRQLGEVVMNSAD